MKIKITNKFMNENIYSEIDIPLPLTLHFRDYTRESVQEKIDFVIKRQVELLVANTWNAGIYQIHKRKETNELPNTK